MNSSATVRGGSFEEGPASTGATPEPRAQVRLAEQPRPSRRGGESVSVDRNEHNELHESHAPSEFVEVPRGFAPDKDIELLPSTSLFKDVRTLAASIMQDRGEPTVSSTVP